MDFYQNLLSHINETVKLKSDDIDHIKRHFKIKEVGKKEIVLYKGDVSRHMRYIASGCLRSYHIDDAGHERTLQFGIENWWINDLYSYLTQSPSRYFIQAIEISTLLVIDREILTNLFDKVPLLERFFRIKIQNAYVALQDRMIDNMSITAEQRYLDFRERYRDIEQRVPQYMIASYLGVTPEFLSAVRKKLFTT